MDVNENLEAALEAAAVGDAISSDEEPQQTEEKETLSEEELEVKETEAKVEEETKGKGAQNRIRELVNEKNQFKETTSELQETITKRDAEIGDLIALLQARESDSQTVENLRGLHAKGGEMAKYVETLDAALRGEEVAIEKATEAGEEVPAEDKKAAQEVRGLLDKAREELEDTIADQQAELILHKAEVLADKYFEQLPDTYNEEDVEILRDKLVDKINWDAIEENPDALPEAFAEGFQETLDWYKTPKGSLSAPVEDATVKDTPKLSEENLEAFAKQDWGELKSVETPDGTKVQPALNDQDFAKELAKAMKAENVLRERR